jgi:hypothetical protein
MTVVALRLVGLRRVQSVLTRVPLRLDILLRKGTDSARVERTAQLVVIAAQNLPFASSCLPNSLVLGWLLRREGICTELRIGVRRDHGKFQAHAWIEHQGLPVNDRQDVLKHFSAFEATELYPVSKSP